MKCPPPREEENWHTPRLVPSPPQLLNRKTYSDVATRESDLNQRTSPTSSGSEGEDFKRYKIYRQFQQSVAARRTRTSNLSLHVHVRWARCALPKLPILLQRNFSLAVLAKQVYLKPVPCHTGPFPILSSALRKMKRYCYVLYWEFSSLSAAKIKWSPDCSQPRTSQP